jgi:hypothetical protein
MLFSVQDLSAAVISMDVIRAFLFSPRKQQYRELNQDVNKETASGSRSQGWFAVLSRVELAFHFSLP